MHNIDTIRKQIFNPCDLAKSDKPLTTSGGLRKGSSQVRP